MNRKELGYIYAYDLENIINKINRRITLLGGRNDTLRGFIYKTLKTSECSVAKRSDVSRDILSRLFNNPNYKPSESTVMRLLPVLLYYRRTYNTKSNLILCIELLKQDIKDYDLDQLVIDLDLKNDMDMFEK